MKIDKHYDPTDDLEKELLQELDGIARQLNGCLLYTSPSPRDEQSSRMPSSA